VCNVYRNSPGSPRSSPLPGSPPPAISTTAAAISTVNMANAMRSLADHLQPLHISVTTTHSGTYRQVVFSCVEGIRVQLFYRDADPDPGSQTKVDLSGSLDPVNYREYGQRHALLADHLQPLHISVTTTHSGTYRRVVVISVVGIRVQFFIAMRIRIQVAKPMRIHPDPDPVNYREHGKRRALPRRPPPAPTHLSHHHAFRYLQADPDPGSQNNSDPSGSCELP
jgi:hypothetical protein